MKTIYCIQTRHVKTKSMRGIRIFFHVQECDLEAVLIKSPMNKATVGFG